MVIPLMPPTRRMLHTRRNRCIEMVTRRHPPVWQTPCTQHRPSVDPRQSHTIPGVIARTLRWGRLHLQTMPCPVMLHRGPYNITPLNPTKTQPSSSSPSLHTSHLQSCDGTLNISLVRPRVRQSRTHPSRCNRQLIRTFPRPGPQLINSPAGRRLNHTITSCSSPVQCPLTRRCRPANRERIRRPNPNPPRRINNPHGRWRRA
jgi:hypothetical protein